MEKGWNKVFISQDKRLTILLISLLDKEGVHAVSINKQDSSYGMFGNIEIYVKESEMHKAKEIINLKLLVQRILEYLKMNLKKICIRKFM